MTLRRSMMLLGILALLIFGTWYFLRSSSPTIQVSSPLPGATVDTKNIVITGKAPGSWYVDAQFPVDFYVPGDMGPIGTFQAQAQGDWKTNNLVPFTANFYIGGITGPAELILYEANPSNNPGRDASITVPIIAK
ncbi:MAG: hypothetical protein ACYC4I_01825 [Minisyncoccota bacterium]